MTAYAGLPDPLDGALAGIWGGGDSGSGSGGDETSQLWVASLQRWAEKRVHGQRQTQGESFDELLMPALKALEQDLGISDLVPQSRNRIGFTLAATLEQVGCADMGLGLLLCNSFAIQRLLPDKPDPALVSSQLLSWETDKPLLGTLVLPDYGSPASAVFHGLCAPVRAELLTKRIRVQGPAGLRPQCAALDAAYLCIACELRDADETKPALLLVPCDAPELTHGAALKTTGMTASRNAEVTLQTLEVPQHHCLVSDSTAYQIAIAYYRLGCAALFQGAMCAAHGILREWGEMRVIKGKQQIFKNNPLVASQMGRIAANLTTGRLQLFGLARLLDHGTSCGTSGVEAGPNADSTALEANSVAVCSAIGQSAMDVMDLSMELMASAGYAAEGQLERYWRDVKTLQTVLGPHPADDALLARYLFGSTGV